LWDDWQSGARGRQPWCVSPASRRLRVWLYPA